MNLQGDTTVYAQHPQAFSATPLHKLGTKGRDKVGRIYRYAKCGTPVLVPGTCLQSPAIVADHLANTPPIAPIGTTSFVYTPGATLGVANQYADGVLNVDTAPGPGRTYAIESHAAFAASTAFTLNLYRDDPIVIEITATSRVGLIANKYNGVILMPQTTATGRLVGVAVSAIPAGEYGWIQTGGICSVLQNGNIALGAMVISPSATTAGAVDVSTAVTLLTGQVVGRMAQLGVSTKYNLVELMLDT